MPDLTVIPRHCLPYGIPVGLVLRRAAWHVVYIPDKQKGGGPMLQHLPEDRLEGLRGWIQT